MRLYKIAPVAFITSLAYACSTSMWVNIALSGGIITPMWVFSPLQPLFYVCIGAALGGAFGWFDADERSSLGLGAAVTNMSLACAALLLLLPVYNAFLTGGFGFPVVTALVNSMLSAGFSPSLIGLCMVSLGAAVGLGLTVLGVAVIYGVRSATTSCSDSVERVATLLPAAIDANNGLGLCQRKLPEIVSLAQDTETQDIERLVVSVDDFAELPSYGQ